jgi:hypothetical protein
VLIRSARRSCIKTARGEEIGPMLITWYSISAIRWHQVRRQCLEEKHSHLWLLESNLKKYCGVFFVAAIYPRAAVAFLQDVLWQGMAIKGLIFRITALIYDATMQRSPSCRLKSTCEVGCHLRLVTYGYDSSFTLCIFVNIC